MNVGDSVLWHFDVRHNQNRGEFFHVDQRLRKVGIFMM
jgi:hypothetical protein